eukprot:6572785-Pyramimonas_sp.AAC.1
MNSGLSTPRWTAADSLCRSHRSSLAAAVSYCFLMVICSKIGTWSLGFWDGINCRRFAGFHSTLHADTWSLSPCGMKMWSMVDVWPLCE